MILSKMFFCSAVIKKSRPFKDVSSIYKALVRTDISSNNVKLPVNVQLQ